MGSSLSRTKLLNFFANYFPSSYSKFKLFLVAFIEDGKFSSRVIFWIWFFPTLSYDPTRVEKVWMVERDWLESSGTRSHRWVDTRGYARVRFHGQATGDRAHALVTPICLLLASAERKRSGCLPLAFRHTPTRALTPPPSSLAKHVPNLEQRRRHANPWDLGPDASILPVFPTRGSERLPPPLSVSFSPFL